MFVIQPISAISQWQEVVPFSAIQKYIELRFELIGINQVTDADRECVERVFYAWNDPLLEKSENDLHSHKNFNSSLKQETFADTGGSREVKFIAQRRHRHEKIQVTDGKIVWIRDYFVH